MLIKDILHNDQYQFSQYIYEFAAVIQNGIQTIVLSNLLNKYCNYSDGRAQTHKNGKQYHFYHSQRDIYSNELFIKKDQFEKAIKELKEKGFISTFAGKQPANNLIEITYFYLNIDAICKAYQQGFKLIHNKDVELKEPKQPKVSKYPASKTNTQQQAALDKLNRDFKSGFITEIIYNNRKQAITNKN